jgi:Phosphotransferase enzyme family
MGGAQSFAHVHTLSNSGDAVAIVKTILVQGPTEQLRLVQIPQCQLQIDIDVNPETALEEIREHFRSCWNAEVHALRWLFQDDIWPPAEDQDPFLVLWVKDLGSLPTIDTFCPHTVSLLSSRRNQLSDSIFRFVALAVRSRDCAPWQRPDWLPRMTEWIRAHVPEPQHVSQVRTSPNCAVLRIRSGNGTYFLKSQPDALAYESALLAILNRHTPASCPRIIPITPDSNTHITEGIAGLALNQVQDTQAWHAALRNVAKLQIECLRFRDELICAGVPCHGVAQVAANMEGVFHDCLIQQNGVQNQLRHEEICRLFEILPEVARDFEALGRCAVPETLVHDDLNLSNVFYTARGETVLIDWALSRITHPFFVLASAIFVPCNDPQSKSGAREGLSTAYLEPWCEFERYDRLRAALDAASRLFWIDATMAARLLCQDKHVDNRLHLPKFLRATLQAYRLRG